MDKEKFGFDFFTNTNCEFYPCHKTNEINCLFCYCPLYPIDECGGNYHMIEYNGQKIKDCSNCIYPHIRENYNDITKKVIEYKMR